MYGLLTVLVLVRQNFQPLKRARIAAMDVMIPILSAMISLVGRVFLPGGVVSDTVKFGGVIGAVVFVNAIILDGEEGGFRRD